MASDLQFEIHALGRKVPKVTVEHVCSVSARIETVSVSESGPRPPNPNINYLNSKVHYHVYNTPRWTLSSASNIQLQSHTPYSVTVSHTISVTPSIAFN